jgi:hypothetical protein
MGKTRKRRKGRKKKVYTRNHYNSGEGMLTSVWGPGLWFFLHTISFNYPNKPTAEQKKHYKNFILQLKYILPCRYCRENLKKNLKALPLRKNDLKNRANFSRWVYNLHELVNKMLGKKSGLTYAVVRERHEHFRSRCTKKDKNERVKICKTKKKREKGCTTPLYGKKAKCVIKIVPQETKCKTFQMDKKCVKERK